MSQAALSGETGTGQPRVNERIDRLPVWGLSPVVYVVLGFCYLLAFYDIAVIGVALPRIVEDLHLSASQEALPITMNLVGYIVGAYFLGTVADRIGRRRTLGIVVVLLTVASILTALSWDVTSLTVFRLVAGIGIGAQITLAATLIGEFAPAASRGRYLARNILWAAFGNIVPALLAIPLLRLPGSIGWRVLFGLSGVIVFALVCFKDTILPESPRWLAMHGDLDRADRVTTAMEDRVRRQTGTDLPPVLELPAEEQAHTAFPTAELFKRPFRNRLASVLAFWFFLYIAVYGFLAFETTLVGDLGVALPNAVLITAIGFTGGVVGAVVMPLFIDRFERKFCVMGGLVVFGLGFVLLAVAAGPVLIGAGSFLASAGIFLVVSPAYAYTAEVFPTRARASAMGVGDGLGHAGGAVQPYIVLPLLAAFGARSVFWLLVAVVAVAFLIMCTSLRTSRRSFAELAR